MVVDKGYLLFWVRVRERGSIETKKMVRSLIYVDVTDY